MDKIIGHIGVDSGQIMVGDPCYLSDWQGHEFADDKPGEYSYAGACTATLSEKGYGELNFGMGHSGAALAVGTAYGDGVYPVTAKFDAQGRIMSITIEFDVADDEEVMDECSRCGTEVEMGTLEDGYCESCAAIYAEDEEDEDA